MARDNSHLTGHLIAVRKEGDSMNYRDVRKRAGYSLVFVAGQANASPSTVRIFERDELMVRADRRVAIRAIYVIMHKETAKAKPVASPEERDATERAESAAGRRQLQEVADQVRSRKRLGAA